MYRHADGSGLIGNGTGDGLPDPPGGVGGELIALGVVELIHRADQSGVALLDQIQNVKAAAGILLCNGNYQTEVCLGELILGVFIALGHSGGQLLLLLGGKQPNLADLLEVHPNRVVQIVFCGQLYRVNQLFLFFSSCALGSIQLQLGANDLNAHAFDGIIDMLDLLGVDVQLFQHAEDVCGLKYAGFLSFCQQRQYGSLGFFTQFICSVICACHIALPSYKVKSCLFSQKEIAVYGALR